MTGISASEVTDAKMHLGAKVNDLSGMYINCKKPIPDDVRAAYVLWDKRYREFWAKDVGFFSASDDSAQLELFRQEFNAWNEQIGALCGVTLPSAVKPATAPVPAADSPAADSAPADDAPPGSDKSKDSISKLGMLGWLALGVAGAVVLALVVVPHKGNSLASGRR